MSNKLEILNQKFPHKRAFITGAASGLGAAYAKLLAENGWTLHLVDINLKELEKTIASFSNSNQVFTYELDISNPIEFNKIKEQVLLKSSGIDLLINNAGIGDGSFFHEYERLDWEYMIKVNLMGTYYGCNAFVSYMRELKSGLILNVGSAAGFMNTPGMSAYNVSKAAVYSLSETLYHELKPSNVHVSVLTPTFFPSNVMQFANGSSALRSFAEKQMKYSKTNADELALVSLVKASKNTFQIIHPKDAVKHYRFKKWLPKMVEKQFAKLVRKISSKS